jgi:pimeloyl-ACP methyl ester carboxylesterase
MAERKCLDGSSVILFPAFMRTRQLVRVGAFCLAAAGLASATYQTVASARDRRRYPPPGELVDIGGRRLHLWRAGESSPAVVVAPSLGEPGYGWAEIQRRLAQHATVVLYDRAGLGWSDPGPWPTGRRMVADLHALLEAAGIPPPYVLVGHSSGGLLMRLYQATQPEQVAGLVLVDSSHPDQEHRLRVHGWRLSRPRWRLWWWLRIGRSAVRPLGWVRLRARGAEVPPHLRRGLPPEVAEGAMAMRLSTREHRADMWEMAAFSSLAAEVGRIAPSTPGSLGRLPLVVISRDANTDLPWPPEAEVVWQELQAELPLLSERSTHLHATVGDHFVHRADPDLVVRVIAELVGQVRAARPAP